MESCVLTLRGIFKINGTRKKQHVKELYKHISFDVSKYKSVDISVALYNVSYNISVTLKTGDSYKIL